MLDKFCNYKTSASIVIVLGLIDDSAACYRHSSILFPKSTAIFALLGAVGGAWEFFDITILRRGISDKHQNPYFAGAITFPFGYTFATMLQKYDYKTDNAALNGAMIVGAMLASYYFLKYTEKRDQRR